MWRHNGTTRREGTQLLSSDEPAAQQKPRRHDSQLVTYATLLDDAGIQFRNIRPSSSRRDCQQTTTRPSRIGQTPSVSNQPPELPHRCATASSMKQLGFRRQLLYRTEQKMTSIIAACVSTVGFHLHPQCFRLWKQPEKGVCRSSRPLHVTDPSQSALKQADVHLF